MNQHLLKDAVAWGLALWLIGYLLGIVLFTLVPATLIGWIIIPIGAAITLWVASTKVKGDALRYYCVVALAWALIAVVGDYLFIVKALQPADGYYKPDVYLYYALALAIPLYAGWKRTMRRAS
jgi:hypothetical protein